MGNTNELYSENTYLDHIARFHAMQQNVAKQVMFFQLALSQSGGKVGTVNWNVEFLQNVGQRPEVVLMPVREYYSGYVVAILFEEFEVRNADVYSVRSLFGKAHAGIKDQHFILVTHSHAIHSKLADAAERNNLQQTTHANVFSTFSKNPVGFR